MAGTATCPLIIMRKFAESFYKSAQWKKCREEYAKSRGYLCERCLARGLIEYGEIVHHKTHIEPWNVNDVSVTLAWDNLELLCRKCHGEAHGRGGARRYEIDDEGHVLI